MAASVVSSPALMAPSQAKRLPVTVLSGFLGAGKSTLLKHLLENKSNIRAAVIVNDMAEINIDAKFAAKVVGAEEKLVEMSNGCICCTLREDLLEQVSELSRAEPPFDCLIIESTGISEPLPVAQTFSFRTSDGTSLIDVSLLDSLVTVVDSSALVQVLSSVETLAERNEGVTEQDNRSLCHLMIDQLEWANIVILNKTDLLTDPETELPAMEALIQRLNPSAKVLHSCKSQVPVEEILFVGLFDMAKAQVSPGWIQELMTEHTPETEHYGISSIIFRAEKPFHPLRLSAIIRGFGRFSLDGASPDDAARDVKSAKSSLGQPKGTEHEDSPFWGVVRSKGEAWVATANAFKLEWQRAGRHFTLMPDSPFFAALPNFVWNHKETPDELKDKVKAELSKPFGGRRTELVFIGMGLRKEEMMKNLEAALLTDEDAQKEDTAFI